MFDQNFCGGTTMGSIDIMNYVVVYDGICRLLLLYWSVHLQ